MTKLSLGSWLSSRNKLVATIVLSTLCFNLPISHAGEVLDLNQKIWQIESPQIPSIGDQNAYLYSPQEISVSRLILSLSRKTVEVYRGEELVSSFPVAVGKEGWETPQGQFNIIQMIKNPAWEHPWNGTIYPPGPDNPLGQRWIGFWTDGNNYIGFHGTPDESLIGQAVSHGCVRMKDQDIKQLFTLVSMGTSVTVVK